MHALIEPIVGGTTPQHLIIAVDFDGTICQHPGKDFPAIGPPVPHALTVLKRIQEAGHKIMLWTMRDEQSITPAVVYIANADIILWGVNGNRDQHWSQSKKQYAHIYIDDAALGCPLVKKSGGRAFADWFAVEQNLIGQKVLTDRWSRDKMYRIIYKVNTPNNGGEGGEWAADSLGDTVEEAIQRLSIELYGGYPIEVLTVNERPYYELIHENAEGRV
jgi:hypothetical protein